MTTTLTKEQKPGKTASVHPTTPRFHVWLRTVVLGTQTVMEQVGWLLELSSTGCQVETPLLVQKSILLELRIFVPDLDWPIMVDGAVVQKVEGNAVHLHFLRLRPKEVERLAWVMERVAQYEELEHTRS
jgi:hypothetical protein